VPSSALRVWCGVWRLPLFCIMYLLCYVSSVLSSYIAGNINNQYYSI